MPASTRLTLTPSSPASDLQAFGQSRFTQPGALDILGGWVLESTALFKWSGPEEVSFTSDTVEIDPAVLSEAVTWGTLEYTALGDLNPEVLAAVLARAGYVDAIYVDDSAGETHIWTILSVYNDVALDAVFDRELELYGYFGKQLAAIEFHVLPPQSVADLGMGRRIFRRVR